MKPKRITGNKIDMYVALRLRRDFEAFVTMRPFATFTAIIIIKDIIIRIGTHIAM